LKVDPDSFCLDHGIQAYRALIAARDTQATYQGKLLLGGIMADSPLASRREAVEKILELGARLKGPVAALDREDLLKMAASCTGYDLEALAKVAEIRDARLHCERMEAGLDKLLRQAQDGRKKGDEVAAIQSKLADGLNSLEMSAAPAPPSFSVDRIRIALANKPAGKPTGWKTLDKSEEECGLGIRLRPAELTATVSRPTHGKTSMITSLISNMLDLAPVDPNEVILVYSFEEPEEFITARLVSIQTAKANAPWSTVEIREFARDVQSRRLWPDPRILEQSWNRLREYEQRLQIVFCPGWDVAALESHARSVAKIKSIGAIFIDYWQKVPPSGGGGMSGKEDRRDIALAVIGRRFKALAVDLNCPVIVGAQAGRTTVKQGTKPPDGEYEDKLMQAFIKSHRFGMEDIREGGIEQEVDLALGLLNYRADYRDSIEDGYALPAVTKFDVGTIKNRYGSTGRWVSLAFDARCQYIRDPLPGELK